MCTSHWLLLVGVSGKLATRLSIAVFSIRPLHFAWGLSASRFTSWHPICLFGLVLRAVPCVVDGIFIIVSCRIPPLCSKSLASSTSLFQPSCSIISTQVTSDHRMTHSHLGFSSPSCPRLFQSIPECKSASANRASPSELHCVKVIVTARKGQYRYRTPIRDLQGHWASHLRSYPGRCFAGPCVRVLLGVTSRSQVSHAVAYRFDSEPGLGGLRHALRNPAVLTASIDLDALLVNVAVMSRHRIIFQET